MLPWQAKQSLALQLPCALGLHFWTICFTALYPFSTILNFSPGCASASVTSFNFLKCLLFGSKETFIDFLNLYFLGYGVYSMTSMPGF